MDEWTLAYDKGYVTDIAYLEFSKAFDSVPHARLLLKLDSYGIKGKLFNWIKNFLIGRQQCVVLNNSKSNWITVTSGVSQGSVLGPLLFTSYVNDILSITNSLLLFADDIKVFRSIKDSCDTTVLQHDIDTLHNWSLA